MNQQLPLAVYYEHPEWFRPLFAEMDRRSIQYFRIDAGCHIYDATATDRKYALFFNRMSASAYLRGNAQGIFFTRDYLAHLDRIGVRVINEGSATRAPTLPGTGYASLAYRELRDPSCSRGTGDWISGHRQTKYRRQGRRDYAF
jgi:hypothetical protein